MESMEEHYAIVRLKQGEVGGLEILARQYYLQAVRAAYLIVQDHALAEDVVQNSFINLIGKINQFDETKPFRPWFMRSVVNNSISACRQRKRVVSLDQMDDDYDQVGELFKISNQEASLEEEYINVETSASVWSALEQLNPQQRAAIVLRYYLELSETDLTEELQRPKSTIKGILFTARRKLRQLLEPLNHDDIQS
jgi:RNA polymerase sigma-70 factor, ECF subfamily